MDITLNLTNGNQETHKNAKFDPFEHHSDPNELAYCHGEVSKEEAKV